MKSKTIENKLIVDIINFYNSILIIENFFQILYVFLTIHLEKE